MRTAMMQWMNNKLPKSRFARNVGMLASGTVLSQGLLVLIAPLLTRLYTPEEFGLLAVYTSILSLVLVVASWLYELAIPLPDDEQDAADLLGLCLLLVLVMTAFTAVGLGGSDNGL
ncbi:oligosaccharide flippase family protein [Tumebacillus flagellatus]|uniref:Polysaccharide biosynthesis protein n=1 Tax=Tumebacillus flagellatus TaxID=1157490 RepID=A0A074LFI9_9BACL|nr:oligosaccharide flippase family protein [Tumebacillus flagellatus]KEO81011.1 hypothetical protein EL26_23000 [Tumebacillus flagellatus]